MSNNWSLCPSNAELSSTNELVERNFVDENEKQKFLIENGKYYRIEETKDIVGYTSNFLFTIAKNKHGELYLREEKEDLFEFYFDDNDNDISESALVEISDLCIYQDDIISVGFSDETFITKPSSDIPSWISVIALGITTGAAMGIGYLIGVYRSKK